MDQFKILTNAFSALKSLITSTSGSSPRPQTELNIEPIGV